MTFSLSAEYHGAVAAIEAEIATIRDFIEGKKALAEETAAAVVVHTAANAAHVADQAEAEAALVKLEAAHAALSPPAQAAPAA